MTSSTLQDLMEQLGYVFQDEMTLKRALTHRSMGLPNNERLEFLGDSVLGFVMAEALFKQHREGREGDLSRMRSHLVNGEMLGDLAQKLGLSDYIHLGLGEEKTGGRERLSIMADTLEAIIGAIYLDGGMKVVRECILSWYDLIVEDLSQLTPEKDPKSTLQEWLQARKFPLPSYETEATGKAHAQKFTTTCSVEGLPYKTVGKCRSRRKAEQIAAEKYLNELSAHGEI